MNGKGAHLFLAIIFETILLISWQESYATIEFVDVTNQSKIIFFGKSYGSAWGDFNNDGYADLWTGNHGFESIGPQLFLNDRNGTFINIFPELSLDYLKTKDLHGAAWADFDNDGDQDLYISVGAGRGKGVGPSTYNVFLVNENGHLIDKAIEYGLEFPLSRGRMPLWFDWDGDGLLDILLVNAPRPDEQAPTTLFHQSSSGFEKILEFRDIKEVDSVHVSDLFHRGKVDLIFLNPRFEAVYELQESNLKNIINDINLKKLRSSDVIIFDFNGDLLPDLFRSTGSGANEPYELDALEINNGKDFTEKGQQYGLVEATSCRSAVAGDFDNDMDGDIFMVCSIWGGASEKANYNLDKNLQNIIYENLGNGTFVKGTNLGEAHGIEIGTGESVSTVDYDNNGFLDLFITNGGGWTNIATGGPHQLFKNHGNNNHWIEIDLIGTLSNRDGIGTKLLIEAGNFTQLREQNGGVHFRTQNHQRIHVGLGENTYANKISVYWPSGIVHQLENVLGDQILQITEPFQPLSPYRQIALGVDNSKVLCKNEKILIFTSNLDRVACVNLTTSNILKERGW